MQEISFEMAQEMGLIPEPAPRYLTTMFPFESALSFERRCTAGELGFRADLDSLRKKYPVVWIKGVQFKVI